GGHRRLARCPAFEHSAIGTAGLAAPRLPLAAFSSVNSLSEAASLLGPCQGLPGTAAHYSSAPNAGHSKRGLTRPRNTPAAFGRGGRGVLGDDQAAGPLARTRVAEG